MFPVVFVVTEFQFVHRVLPNRRNMSADVETQCVVIGPYYLTDPPARDSEFVCKWPDRWPQSDEPGDYAFFDADGSLLYIGKAAPLGRRISSYFKIRGGWGLRAGRRLGRVPATGHSRLDKRVKALWSAEEENLISVLDPPANTVARNIGLTD